MNSREPPKPAAILATPINVEESRAQRLQRQQSRFRDRGGIFVPSSRNTLADILLGKAPPLKKSRRSTSVSPLKRKSLGNTSAQPANLTDIHISSTKNSVKQSRKSVGGSKGDGETVVPNTKADRKGKSKATIQNPDLKESSQSSSKTKASVTKKSKPKAKVGTKNSKQTDKEENIRSSSRTSHSVTKSKAVSKNAKGSSVGISTAHPVDNTRSTMPKPNITNNSVASSKSQKTQNMNVKQSTEDISAKPQPKRRKSYLYSSGGSEDEYVPKTQKLAKSKGRTKRSDSTTTKTATTTKPNTHRTSTNSTSITTDMRLPDIPEEDEEEDISDHNIGRESHPVDGAIASKSTSAAKSLTNKSRRPAADLNVQHKSGQKTSAKSKSHLPSETQSQSYGAPARATEGQSKHADLQNEKEPARRANSTTKKRSAKEAELDEVLQPPQKALKKAVIKNDPRSKAVPNSVPAGRHKSNAESQRASRRSKKRPLSPEPDEEEVALNDHLERTAKRKRTTGTKHVEQLKEQRNNQPDTKKATKARAKKMTVTEAQHSRTKSTKTAKRQEQAAPAPPRNTPMSVIRRGPPKRVLQRLKESQPDILDSEPDPIDFLS